MGQARKTDRIGRAVRADQLLPGVLRSLGVPSQAVTRQVAEAWRLAADPAWRERATPERLVGGVLVVGVSSASLRQELQEFHRERLLRVLQAALPKVPLVRLQFVDGASSSPGPA